MFAQTVKAKREWRDNITNGRNANRCLKKGLKIEDPPGGDESGRVQEISAPASGDAGRWRL
jgi:hypothetical protein